MVETAIPALGRYPESRPRRLRAADWSRRLVAETRVTPSDLIWATVLRETPAGGGDSEEPIPSMPGQSRLTVEQAVARAEKAERLGVPAMALFPFTDRDKRSPDGEEALNPDNLMCRAARAIKQVAPNVGLICDVALDPYTDHGHDGLLRGDVIANDETNAILVRQALLQADAGYDIVAPSDMMDGRIGEIRSGLEKAGHADVQIMSYAVKYASAFYGPYRDAIGSSGVLKGDKKTYQMDPANADEGLKEAAMDIAEGADSLIVKPGLAYLDMIARVKSALKAPTFAFQVSGEYAMMMAAAQNGWLDRDAVLMEALTAFKRAGADGVITYYADWAAERLG
ncbi:MAG: porphobilinogen synthase [Pseudomonadota bacterium]